jgi:hypothetical protein
MSRIGWTRFFLAGALSIFLCQGIAAAATTPGPYTKSNSTYTYSSTSGTITIVPPIIYPQMGVGGQSIYYRVSLYKWQNGGWSNLGTLNAQQGYGTTTSPFRPAGRTVLLTRYGAGIYCIGFDMYWYSNGWVGGTSYYPQFNLITTNSIGAMVRMGTAAWVRVP